VPALLVLAEHDPMVPAQTVRPALAGASALLDVRWHTRGGHVGFPADLDLGQRAPLGLPSQVRSWLTTDSRQGTPPARPPEEAGSF
jgi:predicted alpha/beta-fold hydrolase